MASLTNTKARGEVVKRLRRVEGQLRGVIRMIEEGDNCLEVAQQMTAARRALDSVYAKMIVCFLEQEMGETSLEQERVEQTFKDVGTLLRRLG